MIRQYNGIDVTPVTQAPSSYYHAAGAVAGQLLKTGNGTLKRLVVNGAAAGTMATLYDGTSSAGAVIGVTTTSLPLYLDYALNFNTGLFLVVVGVSSDVTVTYE